MKSLLGTFVLITLLLIMLAGCSEQNQKEISTADIGTFPASGEGYLQVSDGKRYFEFEDGAPFVIIGANEAMTWPGLDVLYSNPNSDKTENYFKMLQEHGVNTIRIMMEYSQDGYHNIEDPIGEFVPETVAYWDNIITLAEKYDIYLLLTPWDTFWMNQNWAYNPYNAKNGGPAESKHDFLTHPKVIDAQKNRLKFMIDRWGNSDHILAWEIMNEIDMWWEASPEEIKAWVDEVSTFVKEYEKEKWGKNHMITVSTAEAVPQDLVGDVIFNHPNIDFANTHLYAEPEVNNPSNTIDAAVKFNEFIVDIHQEMDTPKPYTDTESGPITQWITNHDFDHEYFHNMSWAHLMSGGVGFGMRWPYLQPHTLTDTMRDYQLAMSNFARTIDWSNFASQNIDQTLSVNKEKLIAMGSGDGKQAIVWLLQDTSDYDFNELTEDKIKTYQDAQLTISGLEPSIDRFEIYFWDTYEGEVIEAASVKNEDGTLTIQLPEFSKDIALHIRPTTE
jgi:hypothetical protein